MYGGLNEIFKYSDQAHVLDLSTTTWFTLTTSGVPPPGRAYSTMVALPSSTTGPNGWHGPRLAIFGGWNGQSDTVGASLADGHILDLAQRPPKWTAISALNAAAVKARNSHASVVIGTTMVSFGGWTTTWAQWSKNNNEKLTQSFEIFNDIVAIDLDASKTSRAWDVRSALTSPPAKRAGHTATLYNNKMIIFGGANPLFLLSVNDVSATTNDAAWTNNAAFKGPWVFNDVS